MSQEQMLPGDNLESNTDNVVPQLNTDFVNMDFAQAFAGVLVNPEETLAKLALPGSRNLAGALLIVLLVSICSGSLLAPSSKYLSIFISLSLIGGISAWISVAGTVALISYCFAGGESKFISCLTTVGFATAPWLLFGPLACYEKLLGPLSIIFSLLISLWVFCLVWLAIQKTYKLSKSAMVVLFFAIPVLMGWAQFAWTWHVMSLALNCI
jgi:hypothetical protein